VAGGEALPIKGGVIVSGDAIETVNARDLHAFLEVGKQFETGSLIASSSSDSLRTWIF
jgi:hypothetical protein